MTRDFSKHERDDERPNSRNSSSGSQGEERSPRPARPRLNRDTVDKAWENGARQNHSDYRARDTRGGQPPRGNWQRPQQSGQSSAYNGRNNSGNSRAPYGNRPFDRRQGERTPDRYQGSRPRPFESGMRKFDERQYNQRRDYQPRPEGNDSRYSNNRPPSRSYDNRRDDRAPRSFQRDDRAPRSDDRQSRSFDRDDRPQRRSETHEPRPRGYYREQRLERASGRPDPHNSRWQSRPQRFTPKTNDNTRPTRERERFEGDYEQFDARSASPNVVDSRPQPDSDVTRKPREDQRNDTEFMAEVNQKTDSLIGHIVPANDGATDDIASEPKAKKARATRSRPASEKRSQKTDANPRTPHLKPSHHGFKWPESEKPEQAEQAGEE